MRFLKIFGIIEIVFAIFVFICKRNKINNFLIICFKTFLAQENIVRRYTTTQIMLSPLQPHFFSGVKLSKEVCVHHIEHEPVLLTAEGIYFFIIAHQIHQLLHMQGCSLYFHDSILVMYPIER